MVIAEGYGRIEAGRIEAGRLYDAGTIQIYPIQQF